MAVMMRETREADTDTILYDVDEVVDLLEAAGETTRSRRIKQTLGGANDDEVLPPLRHELRELRPSMAARQLHLEERIDALLHALDRAVARSRSAYH